MTLRVWQSLTVALSVATAALSWTVLTRPADANAPIVAGETTPPPTDLDRPPAPALDDPRDVKPPLAPFVAVEQRPAPRSPRPTVVAERYLDVRHVALTRGVDALRTPYATGAAASASASIPPRTYGQLRRTLLDDESL